MSQPDNNKLEPALLSGLQPLSRRSFLRTFALTGMVVTTAVSAGCSTLMGRRDAPQKLKYKHLKPYDVATIHTMIEINLHASILCSPKRLTTAPPMTKTQPTTVHIDQTTPNAIGLAPMFVS